MQYVLNGTIQASFSASGNEPGHGVTQIGKDVDRPDGGGVRKAPRRAAQRQGGPAASAGGTLQGQSLEESGGAKDGVEGGS